MGWKILNVFVTWVPFLAWLWETRTRRRLERVLASAKEDNVRLNDLLHKQDRAFRAAYGNQYQQRPN
jgi:hypothetical protein